VKNVLVVGPFSPNGRFNGGITSVISDMIKCSSLFDAYKIKLSPFNNCFVKRSAESRGKVSFSNFNNYWIYKKEISQQLKKSHFDFVYIHSSVGLSLLKDLFIAKQICKKTKVVVHVHFADIDEILGKNRLVKNLIVSFLRKFTYKIVLLSEKTKDDFVALGIQKAKLVVVRNFSPYHLESVPNRLSISLANPVEFLFLGSIDNRKGIFDLLDIVKGIKGNFHLTIAGSVNDEKNKKAFQEDISKLGNMVSFLGYIRGDQKTNILEKADVTILPSYAEGLPMSILEGMSYGEAIITTSVGANQEIVSSKFGIIIKPGDKASMLKAIESLCSNRQMLMSMQKEALLASKHYSREAFATKLCEDVFK
jgi:glycosyltransferase involved in cell wall biosynthesis